ncbi:hypothetical protein [Sphingomonas lycopersici]|uniref:Uncharacterized protein n=1 Tax=Sphingomonas lycopersici TaxID=2951807 RepID=A0AA41Z4G2_9SPHN|nr:hypothetical protein [Sphingomonas lycopersici]MCW6533872.1 hypothetical protein [Sphingomonas lycopersici]
MSIETMRNGLMLGAAALLAGCATDGQGDPVLGWADTFGEANKQAIAAQVIDPHPVYDAALAPASGDHAAQAITRYRTDKVKKPERLTTSSVAGSSSGTSGTTPNQ